VSRTFNIMTKIIVANLCHANCRASLSFPQKMSACMSVSCLAAAAHAHKL
jgi:hypothetical protein